MYLACAQEVVVLVENRSYYGYMCWLIQEQTGGKGICCVRYRYVYVMGLSHVWLDVFTYDEVSRMLVVLLTVGMEVTAVKFSCIYSGYHDLERAATHLIGAVYG